MTTEELRKSFLIENLFQINKIPMVYSDIDRSITGSAVMSGIVMFELFFDSGVFI